MTESSIQALVLQLLMADRWAEKSRLLVQNPRLYHEDTEPVWVAAYQAATDEDLRRSIAAHVTLVRQVRQNGVLATLGDLVAEESASAPKLDRRLIGSWEHRDSSVSMLSSHVDSVIMTLGADGRFSRRSASAGGHTMVDSAGNWLGATSMSSGSSPAMFGTWGMEGPHLVLHFEDGDTLRLGDLEIYPDSLLVPGIRQLWRRI